MLTDLVEIHFIELPKFRKLESKDFNANSLQRWLAVSKGNSFRFI